MAIHKNTPKGLHVPNYGGMCSLWGLMVYRSTCQGVAAYSRKGLMLMLSKPTPHIEAC